MYWIHNEGKSVVAKRLIRTLKNKIYKYMTAISKNIYIDTLDDIINEYYNMYHRTIKMIPVDVLYIDTIHILILKKKLMIKIQNLKLVIT